MLGEKDVIFIGAALLAAAFGGEQLDTAISQSAKLYEKIFGGVSDDALLKYLSD